MKINTHLKIIYTILLLIAIVSILCLSAYWGVWKMWNKSSHAVVLQSDFSLKDGAVSAMKGVAHSVDPDLKIYDVTHEISPFNVWEASYRLYQTASLWPKGTVFVSVVDPGVGSERKSIVLKTKKGQYFVSPDNGTLTLVAENDGIEEVREIDPDIRRPQSDLKLSYTFHGRDVYAYTGAVLAAQKISFTHVGEKLSNDIIRLDYQKPEIKNNALYGTIDILDPQYGNVWTNIPYTLVDDMGLKKNDTLSVTITYQKKTVLDLVIPYVHTFSDVAVGSPLAYLNSLNFFSLALNQGSFSQKYSIQSGNHWKIQIRKIN